MAKRHAEGWHGWDDYAPFYDWENARTLGRRDVGFWVRTVAETRGPVLELGCGTGRLLAPLARSWARADPPPGRRLIGIDRSAPMLARARQRVKRLPVIVRPALVRGDVRGLPIRPGSLGAVVAAYGLLQSLLSDRDLRATLVSVARSLRRGGLFGVDLVPDLPAWDEYTGRVPLRGRFEAGTTVTLIESVRQDRRRGLTIFDERYVLRRGRRVREHAFQLTFRTLPMARMLERLDHTGFRVEAVYGGYAGEPWHPEAGVWLVLARRR